MVYLAGDVKTKITIWYILGCSVESWRKDILAHRVGSLTRLKRTLYYLFHSPMKIKLGR